MFPDLVDIALKAADRPTLMFDIDGVLGFLLEAAVTALNARFGTSLVVSEMTSYWLEKSLPEEQASWLNKLFAAPSTYANVAPDFSGIAAVQALHEAGFDVIVSSDRTAAAAAVTRGWLSKWRVPYDQTVLDGRGSKLAVRAEFRAAGETRGGGPPALVLFDDDPRKMSVFPAEGIELWVPQRPWTPSPPYPDGVVVFDEWSEVLERLGVDPDVKIPQFSRAAGPALQGA